MAQIITKTSIIRMAWQIAKTGIIMMARIIAETLIILKLITAVHMLERLAFEAHLAAGHSCLGTSPRLVTRSPWGPHGHRINAKRLVILVVAIVTMVFRLLQLDLLECLVKTVFLF
jgi:hypothetical protein